MNDEVNALLNNISTSIEYELDDELKVAYGDIQKRIDYYISDNRFLRNLDIYETKRVISRYFRGLANSRDEIRDIIFHKFERLTEHIKSSNDTNAINKCCDNIIDEIQSMINLFVNQGLGEFDSSFIYDLKYEVLMGMSSSVPYDVINDFKRIIGNKVEDSMNMFKSDMNRYVAKRIDLLSEEFKNIVKREEKNDKKKELIDENDLGLRVKAKIAETYEKTQPFIHENESLFNSFKEMSDCCDDLLSQNADFSDFNDERIEHFYELMDNFTIEFKRILDKRQKEAQDKSVSKFKQVEKNKSAEKIPDGKKLSKPISWEDTRAGKLL